MQPHHWQRRNMKFDWSGANGPPLTEEDLKDSVINRILRNEFDRPYAQPILYVRKKPYWDPLDPFGLIAQPISTVYVPGKHQYREQSEKSTLTKQQHLLGLRVLSTIYRVQPWDYPKPLPKEYALFEEMKQLYKNEQRVYQLWAKKLWVEGDLIRFLHIMPLLETVYDAEFELKKNGIRNLPHNYTAAAQISLEKGIDIFEMKHLKDLKTVDVNSLPVIDYPEVLKYDVSVLQCMYEAPVICKMHSSSRFKLPYERTSYSTAIANGVSCIASENALQCILDTDKNWLLPIKVVEMVCPESGDVKTVVDIGSEFCVKKESGAIRAYRAFRHLLKKKFIQLGETSNPSLSTPQTANRGTKDKPTGSCSFEPNRSRRTTRNNPGCSSNTEKKIEPQRPDPVKHKIGKTQDEHNFKKPHMPPPNKLKSDDNRQSTRSPRLSYNVTNNSSGRRDAEIASCSSEPSWWREVHFDAGSSSSSSTATNFTPKVSVPVKHVPQEVKQINFAGWYREIDEVQASDQISIDTATLSAEAINDIIGVDLSSTENLISDIDCTCKGTTDDLPPPRSVKIWQVKNTASNKSFRLIIHSSHKVRREQTEVILEPIVEWQPELGACKQSAGRLRALALSLIIRPKAHLINVRLDYSSGNIILSDQLDEAKFMSWHGDKRSDIADTIHAAIDQLRLLKPGQYILKHEARHGANAIIYSTTRATKTRFLCRRNEDRLSLRPMSDEISGEEEMEHAQIAPRLSRAMLPYHKDRGLLPLAFDPSPPKKFVQKVADAKLPSLETTKRQTRNKKKKHPHEI